jgi:hypothetical protein
VFQTRLGHVLEKMELSTGLASLRLASGKKISFIKAVMQASHSQNEIHKQIVIK